MLVVKPNVSAGARDTGRFGPDDHDDAHALIGAIVASGRTALIQPYPPLIDERGETAIVYLAGACSHVPRKRAVLRGSGIAPRAEGAGAPAAVMLETGLVSAAEASDAELRLADAVRGGL